MREKQVIQKIGKENEEHFFHFMKGKTVGVYLNGDINYYDYDVSMFIRQLKRFGELK